MRGRPLSKQIVAITDKYYTSHYKMLVKHDILSATDIDYSNIEEICGYQLLMFKIFEHGGGLTYPVRMNATIREVLNQGKVWLKNVRGIINDIVLGKSTTFTLAAIPQLLSAYDLYNRICNGEPTDDYLRIIRLRTAGLWANGNKSISMTYLVLELLKEINRDNKTIERKYSVFALSALDKWVQELMRYGKFRDLPMAEAYARLHYMITEDLFAYLGTNDQASEKVRWINAYRLSDDQLDTISAETLWAYIKFTQSALIFDSKLDACEDTYINLISKFMDIEDIHPFFREAIKLDLIKYERA